ncbi:5-methylcytosine restriction system specificity protein McrC [Vagococcus lutrae]|uniref:5-methylcytosine restriction system specificity protein McrC n=1 Tax=Vagococcus lutrae TaxID=81947 RepID=UPI0023A943F8|nr:restriction endonuclease [Vagococcus lutrae]WEB81021.1 restriction endonuclease [Vagococcus lutrae]
MVTKTSIPIRNIYYMLAYAYQTLSFSEYKKFDSESFENVKDLYSEILLIGLPVLIRGGLLKDYIRVEDKTTVIRGKIDINSSLKQNALVDKKLVVIYDEFSEDILLNQILKATLIYLSRTSKLSKDKRRKFFSFLAYFRNVSEVELNINLWKKVQYDRQNIRYQFLIDICRYLYEELLILEMGVENYHSLEDEQKLASLYEKFVYAFYKRETHYVVNRPQIFWKVDNGYMDALPIMQTDIVLQNQNKTLIIDTKFYSENMSKRFRGGIAKQKSVNLYQIFTYVKNWPIKQDELVSGMLLYAKTQSDEQPNHHYEINGNQISVVTVDLNQEFVDIRNDLIEVVAAALN